MQKILRNLKIKVRNIAFGILSASWAFNLFPAVGQEAKNSNESYPAQIVCAIDIGSGNTNITVAKVSEKKVELMLEKTLRIPTKAEVTDGSFTSEGKARILKGLKEVKSECVKLEATKFVAVATSGFRKAKVNGQEFTKEIETETGIPVQILDGESEALHGLKSVAFVKEFQPGTSYSVWDIGGGSQEISWSNKGKVNGKMIPVGAEISREIAAKILKIELKDLNEISLKTGKEVSNTVKAMIMDLKIPKSEHKFFKKIYGIGGVLTGMLPSVFGIKSGECLPKSKIVKKAKEFAGKNLAWIKEKLPLDKFPENIVSSLFMIQGVTEALGIQEICPQLKANLTQGILYMMAYEGGKK